jgi:hypothetical protein
MAGKTVLFDVGQFNERGAAIAVYHYAKYNEEILGNTSIIIARDDGDQFSQSLFQDRFHRVMFYKTRDDVLAMGRQADLLYMLTYGMMKFVFDVSDFTCRVGIHCVFTAHHPHGDVYAAISEWVAEKYSLYNVPVVPHIVEVPDVEGDLRQALGIPEEAVVFARYGGYDQFNIPAMMQTVVQCAVDREDLYFLFMNTAPFYEHPRIVFLPKSFDMDFKARFINTADAMIHCRREGETFGLAVGEFSIKKKPVITWYWSFDRHHINVLGDAGIYYQTPQELYRILMNFQKGEERPDRYSHLYNPKTVMARFEKVFL